MTKLNGKVLLYFLIFFLLINNINNINNINPKIHLERDFGDVQTLDQKTSMANFKDIKTRITNTHDPIYIDGDENFTITAANEGWPGSGTIEDPFIIESYSITTNGSTAISINNTQVYFQIRNCEINSTTLMINTGYQLVNVSHGTIMNNTATNFYYVISLTNSSYNRIEGNSFATTIPIFGVGFYFRNSSNNYISKNVVDSFRWGFRLSYSNSNTLTQNMIRNCSEKGFNLDYSDSNNLSFNIVKDGSIGFDIRYSHSNIMYKNTIVNYNSPALLTDSFYNRFQRNNVSSNDQNIRLINSSWNEFLHNVVFNHSSGWSFESNSSYNVISWNTIVDTDYYGLHLSSGSYNNITWNNFLNNNGTGSQIYDPGTSPGNKIEYNHFNEHVIPDANQDGFVDIPYSTHASFSSDPFPRIAPIWINENSDFTMLGFKGNGTINNPYIIDNTHIKSNKSISIFICNTTANFTIRNSVLDGINKQFPIIELTNTTNGLFSNNNIINGLQGVKLTSITNHVELNSNVLKNCTYGIIINSSANQIVLNKNIIVNGYHGIVLTSSVKEILIIENLLNNYWVNAIDDSNGTNQWMMNSYGLHPKGIPYLIHGTAQSYDMNPTELDTDNDLIPDWYEIATGMNRFNTDSDGDLDGDGMENLWEYIMGLNASDPLDAQLDKEQDGLTNLQEFYFGSDACLADTDADGMPDLFEHMYFLQPMFDDSNFDPDEDGYTNLEEFQNGTNPRVYEDSIQSSTTQPTETTTEGKTSTYPGAILVIITISICVVFSRKRID